MQFAIQTDSGLVFEEHRGRFLCRRFVTAEYLNVQAICARRVAEDIRMMTAARSRPIELTEVHDPFADYWEPSDFPRVGEEGGPQ